jgi:large subunit ribosomal protein L21
MYVIVDIKGQQFKAEAGRRLFVHRMDAERGATVEFDQVLLVDNEGKVTIGAPVVAGAKVIVEVLSHVKGEKVIIFKKKRRKGYKKRNGHRQCFTEVLIKEIVA